MEHDKTAGLILRARNGDADAFVELMERNKQSMYKTAKAWLSQEEDVADAISETILDCFEHLDTLREPRYFKTWLVRILINNCSNIRRQNQRSGPAADPEIWDRNDAARVGNSAPEDNRVFLEYPEPLNEEDRRLMILFYVWGFRTREIAKLLHLQEATVKARLQRGREKIKKSFFPLVV